MADWILSVSATRGLKREDCKAPESGTTPSVVMSSRSPAYLMKHLRPTGEPMLHTPIRKMLFASVGSVMRQASTSPVDVIQTA